MASSWVSMKKHPGGLYTEMGLERNFVYLRGLGGRTSLDLHPCELTPMKSDIFDGRNLGI